MRYATSFNLKTVVVQCELPTLAARAVKLESIKRRARAAGIAYPVLKYAARYPAQSTTRVAMRLDVAHFLVDCLREAAIIAARGSGPAKRAVALACGHAAMLLSAEIERAIESMAVVIAMPAWPTSQTSQKLHGGDEA